MWGRFSFKGSFNNKLSIILHEYIYYLRLLEKTGNKLVITIFVRVLDTASGAMVATTLCTHSLRVIVTNSRISPNLCDKDENKFQQIMISTYPVFGENTPEHSLLAALKHFMFEAVSE